MKKRNRFCRMISAVLAAALCFTSVPYASGVQEILTISCAPEKVATRQAPLAVTAIRKTAENVQQTVSQSGYVAKAALGELDGLIRYAGGKNPTADKSVEQPGQNTKRNTATTVIDIIKQTRPASSFYFKLVPYEDRENVWEVCAFYTPLFGGQEQVIRTGLLHDYNTGIISRADGTGALGIGYDFNFDFDTFYAADDPWQRNFGFCPLYDNMSFLIGDFCETIRVPFEYDGRDWMIQIWKGIYSGNMLGAEIGLYNKPTDRKTEFYDCAADPDRIEMSFSVYLNEEKIVESEHKISWWQTAFTYHKWAKPGDLTLRGKLTLQNTDMAKAFAASLQAQNSDVFVQRDGKEVCFTW